LDKIGAAFSALRYYLLLGIASRKKDNRSGRAAGLVGITNYRIKMKTIKIKKN
jgi:hypothetical protein